MKKCLAVCGAAIIGLWLCPVAASAQEGNPCDSQASMAISQCKAKELEALNAEMEVAYQQALQRATTDEYYHQATRTQLEKSQAAWRVYVSENCAYVGGRDGGNFTWQGILSLDCQIVETRARIEFLKAGPQG